MFKKTKLYVAISLIIQAISLVAVFLLLCTKKKSIAYAFLAVAAIEGAAGAYLLSQIRDDEKEFDPEDILSEDFDLDETMLSSALNRFDETDDERKTKYQVLRDENVSEDEFKNN